MHGQQNIKICLWVLVLCFWSTVLLLTALHCFPCSAVVYFSLYHFLCVKATLYCTILYFCAFWRFVKALAREQWMLNSSAWGILFIGSREFWIAGQFSKSENSSFVTINAIGLTLVRHVTISPCDGAHAVPVFIQLAMVIWTVSAALYVSAENNNCSGIFLIEGRAEYRDRAC